MKLNPTCDLNEVISSSIGDCTGDGGGIIDAGAGSGDVSDVSGTPKESRPAPEPTPPNYWTNVIDGCLEGANTGAALGAAAASKTPDGQVKAAELLAGVIGGCAVGAFLGAQASNADDANQKARDKKNRKPPE
ncbi:hypothetical protein [Ectobacillus panaciterrae]|uniref:hypothetical protein n=1 Tax=Ectobacillus panaciterrae TaxID=363872 RepID=UPI0004920217|nr:hypothetical protein [Ectobacillus panaciterrae]